MKVWFSDKRSGKRDSKSSNLRIAAGAILVVGCLIVLLVFLPDALALRKRDPVIAVSVAWALLVISAIFVALQIRLYKAAYSATTDNKDSTRTVRVVNPQTQSFGKLKISSGEIIWMEKELSRLNREIFGEERPPANAYFFQHLTKSFLDKDDLTSVDVEQLAVSLVQQTRKRIGTMEIPFRKPKVEFTKLLPNNEPGHIEFGWDETIIRLHPRLKDDPFGLAAVLCHELAHFILDHNGFRKEETKENERLTDLFIFKSGQGLIYLQGILDVDGNDREAKETILGYLTLEEMAYAHVRCSSQFGIPSEAILPTYYSGRQFVEVSRAIEFLKLKNGELAEIFLCPKNHVLRISHAKKSANIRCPKCGWQGEIWLRKQDKETHLIEEGKRAFDEGQFVNALMLFRKAQEVNKANSLAYCWASRSLKRMGKHQDAIRELRKLLTISPNDAMAQSEMKSLI